MGVYLLRCCDDGGSSVFPCQYHSTMVIHTVMSSGWWTIDPWLIGPGPIPTFFVSDWPLCLPPTALYKPSISQLCHFGLEDRGSIYIYIFETLASTYETTGGPNPKQQQQQVQTHSLTPTTWTTTTILRTVPSQAVSHYPLHSETSNCSWVMYERRARHTLHYENNLLIQSSGAEMESANKLCISLSDSWSYVLVEGPAVIFCLSFTFILLFSCLSSRKRYKDKRFHELVLYSCYTNSVEFSNWPPRSTFILLNKESLNCSLSLPYCATHAIFLNISLIIYECRQCRVTYNSYCLLWCIEATICLYRNVLKTFLDWLLWCIEATICLYRNVLKTFLDWLLWCIEAIICLYRNVLKTFLDLR
jgi:hypothetical protein